MGSYGTRSTVARISHRDAKTRDQAIGLNTRGLKQLARKNIPVIGLSQLNRGLAVARRGQSVIIVEPFRHLGGMHGGGIRIQQDCLYLKD